MKSKIIVPIALLAGLIGAVPVSAQHIPFTKPKDKDEQMKKNEAKNASRYDRLKTYSTDKYASDPDFRDEVDQAYEDLLRTHSERAYEKNVTRDSYIKTVHEDNWRVHVNLYDNLRVQDHINHIGQRLVPEGSDRLFAFRVTPDPIPSAETLATGTIYISTGLISLLDSEAQLSFVLAHEMAHVQLDHWKERVMMDKGAEAYSVDQGKKIAMIGLLGSGIGGIVGGAAGRSAGTALAGAAVGGAAGLIAGALLNQPLIVNWDRVEEDQADEMAFKQVLAANYDVREVPKLYTAMENAVVRDTRVGLGFLGNRKRIVQRREKAQDLLANAYKAEIEAKLKTGFLGDSAEHRNLMAELKRDNGIMAYYHDMFDMARNNLAEAVAIRDNDPAAHYFYGKVLELVGRTDDEHKLAIQSFATAAKFDFRDENYGSYLHEALMMLQDQEEKKTNLDADQFKKALDAYVTNYAQWNIEYQQMRMFPPNLDSIYEYMRIYGDKNWRPKAPDLKELANYSQYYNLPVETVREPLPKGPTGTGGNQPTIADKAVSLCTVAGKTVPCKVGQTGNNVRRAIPLPQQQ
ncbi:MAG: M48 family metalloprotease [Bryobacteraceae bacterium]